jgi:hypothetical protein
MVDGPPCRTKHEGEHAIENCITETHDTRERVLWL